MIIRTDAVVLRHMAFRETSQIVTLFTRRMGKVTVIAKGARSPKSRFGSSLQPLSFIQAVYYHKSTRELQTLTETSHQARFAFLGRDMKKTAIGMQGCELVQAVMETESANPDVFRLLVSFLFRLDGLETGSENLLGWFQLQMADVLGFGPDFERDEVAAIGETGGYLLLETGEIGRREGRSGGHAGIHASRGALRAFAVCARADVTDVVRMQMTDSARVELADLIESFLRFHIEGLRASRVQAVRKQMEDGSGDL